MAWKPSWWFIQARDDEYDGQSEDIYESQNARNRDTQPLYDVSSSVLIGDQNVRSTSLKRAGSGFVNPKFVDHDDEIYGENDHPSQGDEQLIDVPDTPRFIHFSVA